MKKNFFRKINTYGFWVSLASAMLILVQAVGRPLGLEMDEEVYMSVINSVLGVFVLVGIVPKADDSSFSEETTLQADSEDLSKIDTENSQNSLELDDAERQLLISYQRMKNQ